MYIEINSNRKQIATLSEYAGKNTNGAIKVDCKAPSKHHILKTDYEKFKGEDQWTLDTVTKENEEREAALAENEFSTLAVDRAIRALGKKAELDALLESNPIFKREWFLTPIIDLNDDTTKQALESSNFDVNQIKLAIAGILNP